MSIDYNYVTTHINLENIRHNFRLLRTKAKALAPVIKADAYGHGLKQVAKVLEAEGADTMCVGSAHEGAKLRQTGFGGTIVILLGLVDVDDVNLCREYRLVPMLSRTEHIIQTAGTCLAGEPLPVAVKFDSGMTRLGFTPGQALEVAEMLTARPSLKLDMVCSHLAASDADDSVYTLEQGSVFAAICATLRSAGLSFRECLANSAAILAHPRTHLDLQRPGIALYGANPLHGTSREELGHGLKPAMSVSAPVVEVRGVEAGTSISYGCTYVAERDMRVAVVAAGYADGYSRGLSSTAQVGVNGVRAPILGRVCMQLIMVDVSGVDVEPGDKAWLLGGPGDNPVKPEELAAWWGTIPYEVFCLLGLNPRLYEGPR